MMDTLIFDMGDVLVHYQPKLAARAYTQTEEDAELLCRELFGGPEWLLLDMGDLTEAEALRRVCERLPEALREPCAQSFAHWHEYMPAYPEMCVLVERLKARGHRIYLCSNTSLRFHSFRVQIPALELFDGILISAEERCMKPDPTMFRRLFEKFSLAPEQCFFIDDRRENIAAALACGMAGHCFDGDLNRLRAALRGRRLL